MGVFWVIKCVFVSECEIEEIDIWSEIVKRVSMLGESRS